MSQNKIPFKTAYGERVRHYVPTGDGMQDLYEYQIDKFGQKVLVCVGQTNLYEKIQESLEETKIENILNRVAMGDQTVMRPDGIYSDLTEAPKSLIEAMQQMQKLENLWNNLPIDTKRYYGMSLESFIAQSGSEKWLKDMGLLETKEIEVSTQPINETHTNEGGETK